MTHLRPNTNQTVQIMAAVTGAMVVDARNDPDAQATVTDFLDYTEYLPSDLIRSLTLIRKLDESYLSSTDELHELTSKYGVLPSISPTERPDPHRLRQHISTKLDFALAAREASYGEASRLYDEVDRHYNRLTSVTTKLHALPKPPSRDPSPIAQAHSPQASRIRPGKREDTGTTPPPRITLRLDNARATAQGTRVPGANPRPRHRIRKITIPGEVLPPPNPDSPPPFTDSDWESQPPSPIPMPTSRVGAPSRSRSIKPNRIKTPKPPKPPKLKTPKTPRPPRPPRPPGAMGTNVHSAVAGISTSNALSLLTPPPPDAKPGTVHAPWMRLTEWEMARLRKRMKKNAIWTPSETMIRRELSEAGRGPENYRKSKSKAEEIREEFIDCDNIATTAPGKPLVPGEISADSLGLSEKLSNKGMKLNEAKKLKKELLAREQAAIAADETAKLQGDSSKEAVVKVSELNCSAESKDKIKEKAITKTPKKRKRDVTPPVEDFQAHPVVQSEIVQSPAKLSPKKRKIVPTGASINTTTTTTTTVVPLAGPAPSPQKASTPVPQPVSPITVRKVTNTTSRSRRSSVTTKAALPSPEPFNSSSRPASRTDSRRGSVVPPAEIVTREHLRRKSATPAPVPTVTAASRRSKRPAPGPVTNSQDGGAAVSVGRRKNAPRKRGTAAAANAAKKVAEGNAKDKEEEIKAEEEAAGEEIDPDEPRYCLCGDVSFGTMICCENADVSTTCSSGETLIISNFMLTVYPTVRTRMVSS